LTATSLPARHRTAGWLAFLSVVALAVVVVLCMAGVAQASKTTLQFDETFDTPARLGSFADVYGDRFDTYDGWHDTSGHGSYDTARTLSVHDGVLDIWLHSTRHGRRWKHWVAAILPKWECPDGSPNSWTGDDGRRTCHDFRYGRVQITFAVDRRYTPTGYKTAWLLWPASNRWSDGEIDYPESCRDLTGPFCHAVHSTGNPRIQDFNTVAADLTGPRHRHGRAVVMHTAAMTWRRDRVTFTLDGRRVGETRRSHSLAIPRDPMHYVMQTETQTGGQPAPPSRAEGRILVDRLRVWASPA